MAGSSVGTRGSDRRSRTGNANTSSLESVDGWRKGTPLDRGVGHLVNGTPLEAEGGDGKSDVSNGDGLARVVALEYSQGGNRVRTRGSP